MKSCFETKCDDHFATVFFKNIFKKMNFLLKKFQKNNFFYNRNIYTVLGIETRFFYPLYMRF